MEFLTEYHLLGLVIGIATFLIIGLFHPVVVKAEYYWGTGCWWIFLVLGIGGIAWSLLTDNVQQERVRKGWFPANPKRRTKQVCRTEEKKR